MRMKFVKGNQRKFLIKVMAATNCPSLRELSRRFDLNYSTLKNYFVEARLFPKELSEKLRNISGVRFKAEFVENNWGQVIGGKKSRKN